MHRRSLLVAALTIVAAACAETPTATLPESVAVDQSAYGRGSEERVTGHWEITWGAGWNGRYSAHAVRMPDGTVSGQFELHEKFPDGSFFGRVHGDVTCVTILPDGRTARVAGIVTQSTVDNIVGKAAVWRVRDNGEGQESDLASDIRFGYPASRAQEFCDVGFNLGVFVPVEHGNIQVRP